VHTTMSSHWLRWGVVKFLSKLALNQDPPDLCLLSSWDYRLEPLCLPRVANLNRENQRRKVELFFISSETLRNMTVRSSVEP
jgi:hypothetical protein